MTAMNRIPSGYKVNCCEATRESTLGYKQTEVGVIPADWVCEKLEEYFSFISYGFTNPMPTVSQGVFMVTAADINKGCIQLDTARTTTEAAYRTLSAKSKPKVTTRPQFLLPKPSEWRS